MGRGREVEGMRKKRLKVPLKLQFPLFFVLEVHVRLIPFLALLRLGAWRPVGARLELELLQLLGSQQAGCVLYPRLEGSWISHLQKPLHLIRELGSGSG